MKMNLFYRIVATVYDLIDIIYFRNYEKSPRKAVLKTISDHDKILDLCTGTATNAISIAKAKRNVQIDGIDLSVSMLKVAKNKVANDGLRNIKLYHMDATQLKFKDHCFDKILLSLVLHELDEELAGKVIMEAKRVLKDDGEIIITEWETSQQLCDKITLQKSCQW